MEVERARARSDRTKSENFPDGAWEMSDGVGRIFAILDLADSVCTIVASPNSFDGVDDYSSIAPLIFETRSFPNSLFAYPGDFTFYVAHPDRSIRNGAKGISQSLP